MAEELLGWDLGVLRARGDLSTLQHRFVKVSGQMWAGICEGSDYPVGILQNKPASGRACEIRRMGLSKLDIGGTVIAGNKMKPTTNGKGIACTTDGDQYGATALEDGTTGTTITVLVEFGEY